MLNSFLYHISPPLASRQFIERVREEAKERDKWKLMCWNVDNVSGTKKKGFWQRLFEAK